MHLLYYTHSILELHALSTGASLTIVVGSVYGAVRLAVDVTRLFRRLAGPGGKSQSKS